jgi:hypothetical protein
MLTEANIQNYFNMNIKELNNYLQSLPEEIISDAAEIVAETATEYYNQLSERKHLTGTRGLRQKHRKQPVPC